MISLRILREPLVRGGGINKGAIVLSDVDETLGRFPILKKYFYIIERRGWSGINISKYADIKLVEDSSILDKTKKFFPKAILLDMAGADFVDTDNFKPLNIRKEYTGIQISTWQNFKRPELFFDAIKLIPNKKFLKFGHLIYKERNEEELNYRARFIKLAKKERLNVELPYSTFPNNDGLPNNPKEINAILNKAKMGILTSKDEGINRFKLECMSANIPVLVPRDATYPLKKHVNNKTGVIYDPTPEGLARAIKIVEEQIDEFSPREYVLRNTGNKNSLNKLKQALRTLAKRDDSEDIYSEIEYDGRNQSLIWDEKAEIFLQNLIDKLKKLK